MPLHDVWLTTLPHSRTGVTLDEFLRVTGGRLFTPSPVVRALLSLRFYVGGVLGWDRTRPTASWRGAPERSRSG